MELISLQGVCNIRDLSYTPTKDGRHIKPKRLIRSSALCNLTPSDANILLNEYNLKQVIDMRTEREIGEQPNKKQYLDDVVFKVIPPIIKLETSISKDEKNLENQIKEQLNMTVKQAIKKMSYFYTLLPTTDEGIKAYRDFLHELKNNKSGSVLWHCSFGKDRTGFGAVLIEYILGVSIDDIYKDYMESRKYIKPIAQNLNKKFHEKFGDVDDRPFMALQTTHKEYLDSGLNEINQQYGSLDNYINDAMNLSKKDIKEIRDNYLE